MVNPIEIPLKDSDEVCSVVTLPLRLHVSLKYLFLPSSLALYRPYRTITATTIYFHFSLSFAISFSFHTFRIFKSHFILSIHLFLGHFALGFHVVICPIKYTKHKLILKYMNFESIILPSHQIYKC